MSSFGGTVKLTGESEYKKALGEISSNLKVLNSEMKNVTSQYDKNDKSVENLSSQNEVLNKKVEEQEKKVSILKEALAKSAEETGENSEKTKKWQTELNNAQADLNKMNRELDDNADALEEAKQEQAELEKQTRDSYKGMTGFAKAMLECGSGSRTFGDALKGSVGLPLVELKENIGENVDKVKSFASGVGNIVGDMKQMGVVAGLSVAALKLFKNEMDDTGKETDDTADDVEEFGKESDKSSDKASSFGDTLKAILAADVIKAGFSGLVDGIKNVGAKFSEFLALGEETKEMQTNWAKLNASFDDTDMAIDSLYTLTGVLGDVGKATEASVLLAKMSNNCEDLEVNTRILTGVFAQYGESIPTEGLAEAMSATSSMGSVQGVLADALEWQGVNLDEYNEKLGKMTTAEERAAYIQETLTDLYGESADAYREQNKALIESNEAQLRYEDWLAEIGKYATPFQTNIKNMSADLMMGFMPALDAVMPGMQAVSNEFANLVEAIMFGDEGGASQAFYMISEGLTDVIVGLEEALPQVVEIVGNLFNMILDLIAEYLPWLIEEGAEMLGSLMSGIAGNIGTVTTTVLSVVQALLETIIQSLPQLIDMGIQMLTSLIDGIAKMLPELIPMAIDCVITIVETLLDNIDLIIDAAINIIMALADGLLEALPDLVEKIPQIIDKLVDTIFDNFDKILDAGVEVTLALADGLVEAIPQLLESLPEIIRKIVRGLLDCLPQIIECGGDLLAGLFEGLLNPTTIWNSVKSLFNGIIGGIKELFGIHSPSKVFKDEVGANLALGLGEGFDDTMSDVANEMANAVPTEFDASINANMGMAGNTQMSTYDMMVSAFEQALTKVKVVMDDREMGGFVTDTVERVIFA